MLASDLTLEGNGAIIERSSAAGTLKMRLLYVASPPHPTPVDDPLRGLAKGKLTLRNLTLRNGLARGGTSSNGGSGAGLGGALLVQGEVVAQAVTMRDHRAEGGTSDNSSINGGAGLGGNGAMNSAALRHARPALRKAGSVYSRPRAAKKRRGFAAVCRMALGAGRRVLR